MHSWEWNPGILHLPFHQQPTIWIRNILNLTILWYACHTILLKRTTAPSVSHITIAKQNINSMVETNKQTNKPNTNKRCSQASWRIHEHLLLWNAAVCKFWSIYSLFRVFLLGHVTALGLYRCCLAWGSGAHIQIDAPVNCVVSVKMSEKSVC